MKTIHETKDLIMLFDEQHQLVVSRYLGEVTQDILAESYHHIGQLLDAGGFKREAPLNMLADVSSASQNTMFKIGDLADSIKFLRDERIFYVLIVAPPGLAGKMTEFVGTLVAKLSNTRFRVFKTLDDAVIFLESPSNPFYQAEHA